MLVENLTVNLWDCSVGGDRKEEKTLIAQAMTISTHAKGKALFSMKGPGKLSGLKGAHGSSAAVGTSGISGDSYW